MSKKIDTNLGIDVSLTSPSPVTGISVALPSEPKGKSQFQDLADIFKNIQPAVNTLAGNEVEKQAKEDMITGANKINSMTREEAMSAHEKGFPDVYNGWVRHGMYKQISKDSAETFHLNFLENYTRDRVDPNYNWEKDYAERTKQYLQGKENDPFWNKSFAEASAIYKKTILANEFEHQNDVLKKTITAYTVKEIRELPDKLEAKLSAAWFDANPITENDNTYNERKLKFFSENSYKFFLEGLEDIKKNRNVAIDKTDFDSMVMSAAEAHIAEGGSHAQFFGQYIISKRPDGTPSIADKAELKGQYAAILKKINDVNDLAVFGNNFRSFQTANFDNTKYNELSDKYFENAVRQATIKGNLNYHDAVIGVIAAHKPYIAGNRPIPFISDLINRPLGQGGDTADNKLSLAIVKELSDSGALATYFKDNQKKSLLWNMGLEMMRNGEPTSKIFNALASIEKNQNFVNLTETEKKQITNNIAGANLPANQDLIYTIAQYNKNAGVTDINKITKDYLTKNYFQDSVGKWIPNSKVIDLGISKNEYEMYADTAYKILSEKIDSDVVTPLISDTAETNPGGIKALANKGNYNFAINSEGGYAYFTIVSQLGTEMPVTVKKYFLDDKGMKIPATDEKGNNIVTQDYKHQEVILQIPLSVLKSRVTTDMRNKSLQDQKKRDEADELLRQKNKAIDNWMKLMGGNPYSNQTF